MARPALGVCPAWPVLAFGVRSVIVQRWTGDMGLGGISGHPGSIPCSVAAARPWSRPQGQGAHVAGVAGPIGGRKGFQDSQHSGIGTVGT